MLLSPFGFHHGCWHIPYKFFALLKWGWFFHDLLVFSTTIRFMLLKLFYEKFLVSLFTYLSFLKHKTFYHRSAVHFKLQTNSLLVLSNNFSPLFGYFFRNLHVLIIEENGKFEEERFWHAYSSSISNTRCAVKKSNNIK